MEPLDIPESTSTTAEIVYDPDVPQVFASEVEVARDRDWIAIDLLAGQGVQIDLVLPSGDAFLVMRNETGGFLQSDDDGGQGLDSRLRFYAEDSATYYIDAGDLGGRTGSYTVTVTALPPEVPGDASTTVELTDEILVYTDYFNDVDWFAMQLEAGEIYTVTGTSLNGFSGLDEVFLPEPEGLTLLSQGRVNGAVELVFAAEQSGVQYVAVQGSFQSERFSLEFEQTGVFFAGTGADDVFDGDAADDLVRGRAGDDTLSGGSGDDDIQGGFGNDSLMGGGGADSLIGGAGDDYVSGGDGDDLLRDSLGDDTLVGGAGRDTLTGGLGDDTLNGGSDQDVLNGGAGSDRLVGGDGADRLLGRAGDDTLLGGAGEDTLAGGGGADLMTGGINGDVFTVGLGQDTITDFTFGVDVLDLPFLEGGFDDILELEQYAGTTAEGDLVLTFNLRDSVTFEGLSEFYELSGIQLSPGGPVADRIEGGIRNDSIEAAAGDDTVFGRDGNDTVFGGFGDDIVLGGNGMDSLSGNDGADDLRGQAGDDQLSGGRGMDLLQGGAGADVLLGGDDADQLFGDQGSDRLRGQAGEDLMSGGDGADSLYGGDGADTLMGDAGSDTLSGARGDDSLIGGQGADRFVFTLDGGFDRIADFQNNIDEIALSSRDVPSGDVNDLRQMTTLDAEGNLVLNLGLGRTLTIEGVSNTTAILDDIVFL